MKKIVLLLILLSFCQIASAAYVEGYYRKDGTYVAGHYKKDSNSINLFRPVKTKTYKPAKKSIYKSVKYSQPRRLKTSF